MSTVVDQKVVEMRFDNKQFETNVATTMSTVDKLKQKLNFTGAAKGLDNVSASAKKVNMNGLSNAVESVRIKFSALEVIGVTALANITNSAVNAGKRMISALAIDSVKTGFQEYETQINAVQTILANTSSKGTTIDQVNAALDELNKYADLTIYNFTEMTRNIGTFTAAGIDLKTSTNAIQGIANLAAVSGSTSTQASTAMLQLSQALAAGTVKLQDWNSVVNAGMGGQVFQDALKKTSRELGTGVDNAIKKTGSFRESLREGWITAEVLTETLKKFTTTGANEYIAKYTGLELDKIKAQTEGISSAKDEAKAIDEAAEAIAKMSGKNKDVIKESLEFAYNAENAAIKVKTLSQLWDGLKETAQSGWGQTWKLLLGDFEQAKSLFTPLSKFLNGIVEKTSDLRNNILKGALGSPIGKVVESLSGFTKQTKETVKNVENLGKVVSQVIRGDFGNDMARFDALTKANQNYYKIQNEVNKTLGYKKRYSKEQIDAQDKLLKSQQEITKEEQISLGELAKMTDEQLKSIGATEEQISAIKDLAKQADKAGVPIDEFVKNLDQLDGRTMFIESFKNAGQGLVKVVTAIVEAWKKAFYGDASDEEILEKRTERLYKLISAIHDFSKRLVVSDETAKKIQHTFKGVFAMLDLLTTLIGGPLKVAFKLINSLLNSFGLSIWDVTANLGDALVKLRDFVDASLDFNKIFEKIKEILIDVKNYFAKWFEGFKESDNKLQYVIDSFTTIFKKIKTFIEKELSKLKTIIKNYLTKINDVIKDKTGIDAFYIIKGLSNGIVDNAPLVWDAIVNLAKSIINKFETILGIASPSKVMYAIGGFIVLGLIGGIKHFLPELWAQIGGIGQGLIDELNKIDWGAVVAAGIGVGALVTINNIVKTLDKFAAPAAGLGKMFSSIGGLADALKTKIDGGTKWQKRADMFMTMAKAIALIAASIFILGKLDAKSLYRSAAILGLVMIAIVGVLYVINKYLSDSELLSGGLTGKATSFGGMLLMLAGSLMIVAIAVKKISKIDPANFNNTIETFIVMIGGLAGLVYLMSKMAVTISGTDALKIGGMLLMISGALLLTAIAFKRIAKLDPSALGKGLTVVTILSVIFAGLIAITKLGGANADKAGVSILAMSAAMLLAVRVIKIAGNIESGVLAKGLATVAALGFIFSGMIAVTKLAGKDGPKAGGLLLEMAAAMLIVSIAIKALGTATASDLAKATAVVAGVGAVFAGIVAVSKFAGQYAAKAGLMLIEMSAAMLILSGAIWVLSRIDTAGLLKAVIAVTAIMSVMGMLIAVTYFAKDVKGTLIVITVAISILMISLAALSLIDAEGLKRSVIAITSVMISLAALVAAMSLFKGMNAGGIVGIVGVILVLSGLVAALWVLSKLNMTSTMENVKALSLLALALSASILLLSVAGSNAIGVAVGVSTMLAMVIPLFALIGVLAVMNKVGNATENAAALGKMVLMLSLAMIPLALAGSLVYAAFIGVLALTAMAIPLLAFVGVLAAMQNIQNATENVNLLVTLMTAMAEVLVTVGLISPLAILAVAAMAGLTLVMSAITIFATAIGGLATHFPKLEEYLNKGIPILNAVAFATGSMIGSFVSGISTSLINPLPALADSLNLFLVKIIPFVTGLSIIPKSAIEGAKNLAGAILVLMGADFIAGLASILPSSKSLPELGRDLSRFMLSATGFILGAMLIKPGSMTGVEEMANAILAFTKADLVNSLASMFGGGDMEEFASKLEGFGAAIVRFSNVVHNGNIDDKAVEAAASAGEIMVALAKDIPNSGGILGDIVGNNDIDDFGNKLVKFGSAMVRFSSIVSVKGAIDQKAVKSASAAADIMIELSKEIPNSGGIWGWLLAGDNDLADFGDKIIQFGYAMVAFSSTVAGRIDQSAVEATKTAADVMVALAKDIPTTGGIVSWFKGNNKLDRFGDQIVEFGEAMVKFSDTVSGKIDSSVTTTVATLGEQIRTTLEKVQADEEKITRFKTNLTEFGNAMIAFSDQLKGKISTSDMYWVTASGKAIAEMAAIMPDEVNLSRITNGLDDFGTAMISFSDKVKEGINKEQVDVVIAAGTSIATMLANIPPAENITAFVDNAGGVADAINDFATNAGDAVDSETIKEACSNGKSIITMLNKMLPMVYAEQFITYAASVGIAIKNFGTNVNGINKEYIDGATDSGKKIADLINSIDVTSDPSTFTENAKNVAEAIIDFSKKASEGVNVYASMQVLILARQIENMMNSFNSAPLNDFISNTEKLPEAATNLKKFAENIAEVKIPDLSGLASKFKTAGEIGILGFIKAFDDANSKASAAGSKFVNAVIESAQKKAKELSDTFSNMVKNAATALKSPSLYVSFYGAGKYLVDGFALGITANSYKAAAKAGAMANAAAKAARKALNEHSPSKVFYGIGDYAGQGFINALNDYVPRSYDVATNMAESARNGLASAITKVKDMIESGIDSQPTIRPVLDVSEIADGVGAINGMLNFDSTVGVMSNVRSISSMMNQNQNRTSDVADAINELKGIVGNKPGDTYNINGVTYDDGSNISDAVKTLVRAARIERRV